MKGSGVGWRGPRETDTEKELERGPSGGRSARPVEEATGTLQPQDTKDSVGSRCCYRRTGELQRPSVSLRSLLWASVQVFPLYSYLCQLEHHFSRRRLLCSTLVSCATIFALNRSQYSCVMAPHGNWSQQEIWIHRD